MAPGGESFQVCGLCSEVVCDAVGVGAELRAFLSSPCVRAALGESEFVAPASVCTGCRDDFAKVQAVLERCRRAVAKIRKVNLPDAMILGRTEAADAVAKPFKNSSKPPPVKKPTKKEAAKRDIVDDDPLAVLAPRATRSTGPTASADPTNDKRSTRRSLAAEPTTVTTPKAPKPKEVHALGPTSRLGPRSAKKLSGLSGSSPGPRSSRSTPAPPPPRTTPSTKTDKKKVHQHSTPGTIVVRRKKGQYKVDKEYLPSITVPAEEKNLAEEAEAQGGIMSFSRKRKASQLITPSKASPAAKKAKTSPKPSKPASPPSSVSSFGRVRKPKTAAKDFVDFSGEEEQDPIATCVKTPNGDESAAKNPAGPASKKKKPTSKKKSPNKSDTVYVDEQQNGAQNVEDEDEREVFPSIGPYQCEICQDIFGTKLEFVTHIKKMHRDVVDEEVLRSLEQDLEKSKRKQEKANKKSKKKDEEKFPSNNSPDSTTPNEIGDPLTETKNGEHWKNTVAKKYASSQEEKDQPVVMMDVVPETEAEKRARLGEPETVISDRADPVNDSLPITEEDPIATSEQRPVLDAGFDIVPASGVV